MFSAYLMLAATPTSSTCAFCLGPEDAVYLVGPGAGPSWSTMTSSDRIAGSSILYVDDHFPTAMTLGHPSLYRRRRR